MTDVSITRHDNSDSGEYRAHIEGSDQIGRLTWIHRDGVRTAEHTLVPDTIGGRGVAGVLVDALIADAREHGFKVKPTCSYVVHKFEKYAEWADLRA